MSRSLAWVLGVLIFFSFRAQTLGQEEIATAPAQNDSGLATTGCITPPSDLVSWWDADASVAPTAIDIQDANNGTMTAGVQTVNDGKVGQKAFSFNGSDGLINIPYNQNYDQITELTVDFWVKPSDSTAGATIVGRDDFTPCCGGFNAVWKVGVTQGNFFYEFFGPGNGGFIQTVSAPVGQYSHVAITYQNGVERKMYVNGQLVHSALVTGTLLQDSAVALSIGARGDGGEPFNGEIDELEIFNRALPDTEIQSIFNAGSAGKCKVTECITPPSDLVSWWDADAVSGTTAMDIKDDNNGTLVNGATTAQGRVGNAFSFDGNGYVSVAHNSNLDVGTNLFVDFWIFPRQAPSSRSIYLVNKWVNARESKQFSLGFDRKLQFALFHSGSGAGPPGTGIVTSTNPLPRDTWTHVAGTYDGTEMKLYINGILDNSVPFFLDVADAGGTLFFGRNPDRERVERNSMPFDGLLDEIEWGTTVPSDAEIKAIADAGSAGKCKT